MSRRLSAVCRVAPLALLLAGGGCGTEESGVAPLVVGLLIEDGVFNTELTAPMDILHHTIFHADPGMKVCTIARSLDPVTSFEGLSIRPDHDYGSAPPLDVLVVPSAERHVEADFEDERLIAFVRERAEQARFVMSLCDGAFVLAKAGLLDGRYCTTFPGDIPALIERYPQARVLDGPMFVVDGKYITSVGGARSFEPSLYLVERMFGSEPARGVARGMVIDWDLKRVPHYIHVASDASSYEVGEVVDADVVVQDASGEERRLLEVVPDSAEVIVLFVFGGGDAGGKAARAGLWCEDSLNEMPLLRHAMARFEGDGVTFVVTAVPPVLHEQEFGHEAGAFSSRGSEHLEAERERFVRATDAARVNGVIPGDEVWYDFHNRLLQDLRDKPPRPTDPVWVGRFRAPREAQLYGTPTIWVLSREGEVLLPPFHANNYEKDVALRYTPREFEAALRRALESVRRRS